MIHHSLNDLPDLFEQSYPAIFSAILWDEDRDEQPELGGDTAFVPNFLHEFSEGTPLVVRCGIRTLRLLLLPHTSRLTPTPIEDGQVFPCLVWHERIVLSRGRWNLAGGLATG